MSGYNLVTTNGITQKEQSDVHLRSVDLNLLTVFDAVMQMQNVTRAAQSLGMSQPAVSNAVARLKIMFDDELFFVMDEVYSLLHEHVSFLVRYVRHYN
ncbi:Transcriptional regulator [Candidatus Regiella insecticola 5.15]|uniref:Transcriptional regulator n=1 Tax=Candidatus Regiella insecticola 5.15 TaxID=1005043 RepID=G2GY50_9ENTR|nr:Transcriptional regulator [Candidatus Regiella insecticola 5.15]